MNRHYSAYKGSQGFMPGGAVDFSAASLRHVLHRSEKGMGTQISAYESPLTEPAYVRFDFSRHALPGFSTPSQGSTPLPSPHLLHPPPCFGQPTPTSIPSTSARGITAAAGEHSSRKRLRASVGAGTLGVPSSNVRPRGQSTPAAAVAALYVQRDALAVWSNEGVPASLEELAGQEGGASTGGNDVVPQVAVPSSVGTALGACAALATGVSAAVHQTGSALSLADQEFLKSAAFLDAFLGDDGGVDLGASGADAARCSVGDAITAASEPELTAVGVAGNAGEMENHLPASSTAAQKRLSDSWLHDGAFLTPDDSRASCGAMGVNTVAVASASVDAAAHASQQGQDCGSSRAAVGEEHHQLGHTSHEMALIEGPIMERGGGMPMRAYQCVDETVSAADEPTAACVSSAPGVSMMTHECVAPPAPRRRSSLRVPLRIPRYLREHQQQWRPTVPVTNHLPAEPLGSSAAYSSSAPPHHNDSRRDQHEQALRKSSQQSSEINSEPPSFTPQDSRKEQVSQSSALKRWVPPRSSQASQSPYPPPTPPGGTSPDQVIGSHAQHPHEQEADASADLSAPMPVDLPCADAEEMSGTQGHEDRCRAFAMRGAKSNEGLGIWRRKRAGRSAYLSLQGDTLTGRGAMEQSKKDKARIAAGATFDAKRVEIREACLQAQATAAIAEAPTTPEDDKAELGSQHWGLPHVIVRSYQERNVSRLFPWQVECLEAGNGRVLQRGGNLVYSAPTSGGKTMVAEILMIRALTHRREPGTVIFVVPFIALAEEKAQYFRKVWGGLGIGVKSFHSDAIDATLSENVHVAVCTIERANALVNRLLERGELRRISLVVVDELHMIGDDHRGFLIEVMLAKLRMASSMARRRGETDTSNMLDPGNSGALIQIVGLSATLPNLPQVAQWLNAELYITTFRPVRLSLMLCDGLRLEQLEGPPASPSEDGDGGGASKAAEHAHWRVVRQLSSAKGSMADAETEALIGLCREVADAGQGVLVFCSTRSWTETCARRIAEGLRRATEVKPRTRGPPAQSATPMVVTDSADAVAPSRNLDTKRRELVEKLRHSPVGLSPELETCVPHGVAFHHAGLTIEERVLVEQGFKAGVISVLVATTTLAAGVNLPARRVIVRDRKMYKSEEISVAQFQQMCGRAGRFGIDAHGEAILMTKRNEAAASKAFMRRQLPPMVSVLDRGQGGGIERAVLEVVAGGLARGHDWLETFMRCTLYAAQQAEAGATHSQNLGRFRCALAFLVRHRFVEGLMIAGPMLKPDAASDGMEAEAHSTEAEPAAAPQQPQPASKTVQRDLSDDDVARLTDLTSTQLGAATFFAAMAPHDAAEILSLLSAAASRGVILTSDLHLLFLCVPPNRSFFRPEWGDIYRRSDRWRPEVLAVASALGIQDGALQNLMLSRPLKDPKAEPTLRRFVYALVLHDMLQEVPLVQMESQKVPRGSLQTLRTECKMFCGMVVCFCKHLKWERLARLIGSVQGRLEYGVAEELLPLFRLGPDLLHAHRARALFDAGYKTHEDLAAGRPEDLCKILMQGMPFETGRAYGGAQIRRAPLAERISKLIIQKARDVVMRECFMVESQS